MEREYEELRRTLAEISDLGRARALLAWDERTMMPRAGGAARAEQLATLARVRHERATDPRLGRLLETLRPWTDGLEPDSDEAAMVRIATREWEKARLVPVELRAEMTRASSLGEQAWIEARERSDYAAFLPHLERNLELARSYAERFTAVGWDGISDPYDALLDDYEPGVRRGECERLLSELRAGLAPLVERAAEAGPAAGSPLHGVFPIAVQQELAAELAAALPLPAGGWRLDTTVHPFAVSIGHGDTRITTRYDEGYLGTALWSVMHEGGHAIYDAGVPERLRRSPLGRPSSLGFHESQSRLWENQVGRGRPFCEWLAPRLARRFDALADLDAEALFAAANLIEPSLIRVEADEVTYNLHIALRFELELELIGGRLEARDLPAAWNERVYAYLGLEVPDDASGVLQDVHWAGGAFGYFPTYSLGNVLAAQLWERALREAEGLEASIAGGDFAPLGAWLGEVVHSWGGKLLPGELAERTVGGFDTGPLLAHLAAKVSPGP